MTQTAMVVTHRRPDETRPALQILMELAAAADTTLRFSDSEVEKHGLEQGDGLELGVPENAPVDICFALGGDGTILSALRTYAGTGVPVFGINFGEVGFLAASDRDEARAGFEQALAGEFDVYPCLGSGCTGLPATGSRSTTSRSSGNPGSGSRTSPTRSAMRRSGASAATAWSSRPPLVRPATTSPTEAR